MKEKWVVLVKFWDSVAGAEYNCVEELRTLGTMAEFEPSDRFDSYESSFDFEPPEEFVNKVKETIRKYDVKARILVEYTKIREIYL